MKAMILAAGRGERMRPLTDRCPKPLLRVQGIPLIEYHIRALIAAGVRELVINHAWLGQQIVGYCGNGERWGIRIAYSDEQEQALETAGGIIRALPLLGDEPFLVLNGDIFTDIDVTSLPVLADNDLAHLVLVPNPEHNPGGDFSCTDGRLQNPTADAANSYTFAGIGLYRPAFFQQAASMPQVQPLAPLLRQYADENRISATIFEGLWCDVGTPERLRQLNHRY